MPSARGPEPVRGLRHLAAGHYRVDESGFAVAGDHDRVPGDSDLLAVADAGGAPYDGHAVGLGPVASKARTCPGFFLDWYLTMTTLVFVSGFCLVAVFVYMARYSGRVRVEQVRLIDAPLDAVFAKVVDLAQWQSWNPWLEAEAAPALTLSERCDQQGSRCAWTTDNMGTGWVEHVRLVPRQRIDQRLRLQHPFTVSGRSSWTFKERAGKTEVTWSLRARVGFSMRAFASTVKSSLALDCRYGLDELASLLEPVDAPRYSIVHLGVRDVAPGHYAYRAYQGTISGLPAAVRSTTAELSSQMAARGIQAVGTPMAVYFKTNIKLRTTVCHIGISVDTTLADDAWTVRALPAQRAYVVRLQGNPKALEIAWYHAMQRMVAINVRPDQRLPPFERYLVQGDGVNDNDCVTELYLPVLDPVSVPGPLSQAVHPAPI